MEAPALPLRDIEISASRKVAEEERRGDRGRGEGAKTSVMAKGGVRDAAPPRPLLRYGRRALHFRRFT